VVLGFVNLPIYAEKVGVGGAMIGVPIAVYDFAEILTKPVLGPWPTSRA
jgi:hypothetical protein